MKRYNIWHLIGRWHQNYARAANINSVESADDFTIEALLQEFRQSREREKNT